MARAGGGVPAGPRSSLMPRTTSSWGIASRCALSSSAPAWLEAQRAWAGRAGGRAHSSMTAMPAGGNGGASPPGARRRCARSRAGDPTTTTVFAATGHGLRHVLCSRSRPEQLDRLRRGTGGARDLLGRLSGAKQGLDEHGVGRDALSGEARAEVPRSEPGRRASAVASRRARPARPSRGARGSKRTPPGYGRVR